MAVTECLAGPWLGDQARRLDFVRTLPLEQQTVLGVSERVLELPDDKSKGQHQIEHAILAAVITTVAVVIICAIPIVMWVWAGSDIPGDTRLDRSRTASPLLTAAIAAVTLLTVLWRGAIASRQAGEQKRQNDSKDEVELGLLLEKSASRLKEDNIVEQNLAIVMIESIVLAENHKYAVPALELLRDQWWNWHATEGPGAERLIERAERLFAEADRRNRVCPPIDIIFNWSPERFESIFDNDDGPYRYFWNPAKSEQQHYLKFKKCLPIRNLSRVKIDVSEEAVSLLNEFEGTFEDCWFHAAPRHASDPMKQRLVIDGKYNSCTFLNLSLKRVGNPGYWTSFVGCDFSATVLENRFVYVAECSYENCRYHHKTLPILQDMELSRVSTFLLRFDRYFSAEEIFSSVELPPAIGKE